MWSAFSFWNKNFCNEQFSCCKICNDCRRIVPHSLKTTAASVSYHTLAAVLFYKVSVSRRFFFR